MWIQSKQSLIVPARISSPQLIAWSDSPPSHLSHCQVPNPSNLWQLESPFPYIHVIRILSHSIQCQNHFPPSFDFIIRIFPPTYFIVRTLPPTHCQNLLPFMPLSEFSTHSFHYQNHLPLTHGIVLIPLISKWLLSTRMQSVNSTAKNKVTSGWVVWSGHPCPPPTPKLIRTVAFNKDLLEIILGRGCTFGFCTGQIWVFWT